MTTPHFVRSTPAPRLTLRVEREGGQIATRELTLDGEVFRVGAHASNDLVIADPEVSRFHLRLTRDKRGWRLTDSDSLNGTLLQGVRVQDAYLPTPECVLDLGSSRVRVQERPSVERIELLDRASFGDLYGTSIEMQRLFAVLERVAQADANVLVEGESGTGKELVATELVRRGRRQGKPFVIVDCGAISPNLIEADLFGHVKGAFTGADRDRMGAFETANEGTVFLDEVGELPLEMQPKLLRVLESREVRRVGESRSRKVDVRVVAATNRRLEREVNHGRFREDLYFRLSVVTVRVPPLRERLEDLDLLVRHFLGALAAKGSGHLFTREIIDRMRCYDWPGNVRELRNFVERSVILQEASLDPAKSAEPPAAPSAAPADLELAFKIAKERAIAEFERRYVTALLDSVDGNISRASRKAGMDRMTLYRLIQRHGLRESRTLKD